jgi:hypothetical protein
VNRSGIGYSFTNPHLAAEILEWTPLIVKRSLGERCSCGLTGLSLKVMLAGCRLTIIS